QAAAWMYSYTEQKDYTWEQARSYCQTYFTDLVAIQNKKEIEYLNEWLPFHPRYYWIGIRKLNGTWTWVGTRKALTKEAENWAAKEPNNKRSNQDCVEIYIKRQREPGKWNDEPCNKRKRALCYEASCQPLPCSRRGQCVETIGNYSCECQPGFHGRDCENGEGRRKPCGNRGCPGDRGAAVPGVSWQPGQRRGCEDAGGDKHTLLLSCGQCPSPETSALIAALACPVLGAPDWGELSCSHPHGNFSFGSTCTFSCRSGFELMGTASRECMATGTWSGDPPHCEATRCPTLIAPSMGDVACSHPHGNFSFGSTCTFSCRSGFELMGTASRECTATGTWSGDPPHCEAIRCPAVAVPSMGHAACSHPHGNFSFGSTCTFSCQSGFELTGTTSRECTATGTWSGDPPHCEGRGCSHPHGNFSFGSTCTFSCRSGFELTGTASRECTATGTWSGDPPHCEAIRCPTVAAPSMGHAACSHPHGNFSFGSTCTFSCQSGFELMGTTSRECTAMGTWSGDPPHCEGRGWRCSSGCHSPVVTLGCFWTPHVLRSQLPLHVCPSALAAIKCPTLVAPSMGDVTCSHPHGNFSFGSTCTFSCQSGFELTGTASHECTATGTWSGDTPTCKAVGCPALDAPSGGRVSCSHPHGNFSFNSSCSFSCEAGLVRRGAKELLCTATGAWSRRPPLCAG
ncbi:LYAM3 protein, partial [Eudromia elegans]|nr:LYAM3 protein [Eudromia elegans]